MPSLTLQRSHEQLPLQPTSLRKLPRLDPLQVNDSFVPAHPTERPPSPLAPPDYSPITPRAQPALPATFPPLPNTVSPTILNNDTGSDGHPPRLQTQITPALLPTEYIPEPAPQPFSGDDATDAIALRAAISTLQIQKKKAQDDIRKLETIKKKALDEPEHFKSELAAGRLKEQKPSMGDLQAILDYEGSDDDNDDDDEQAVQGARRSDDEQLPDADAESTSKKDSTTTSFDRIPGPQNVVRMPYVNWDKYHITGEPLDSLHEQQRKWPGQMPFSQDRGREYAIAAPYSPWLDSVDGQGQQRWDRVDSMTVGTPTTTTPTGTISEHPMETRRRTGQ